MGNLVPQLAAGLLLLCSAVCVAELRDSSAGVLIQDGSAFDDVVTMKLRTTCVECVDSLRRCRPDQWHCSATKLTHMPSLARPRPLPVLCSAAQG